MRRTVALLVAVVAVGGCAGPSRAPADRAPAAAPPSTAAVPEVPGIAAEDVRLRTDEAEGGRIQVRVTATRADPFTVTAVALDAPGFEPLPPAPVTAAFDRGRVIDLPTPYGAVICPAGPGTPSARLSLVRSGGREEEVRAPLPGGTLARVHGEECAALAVAEAVDVTVTVGGPEEAALPGRLGLTRRSGSERVVVERLGGSVLLDVTAELPLELAPADAAAGTAVVFALATCAPHVLAETKQPFVFPLAVRLGDAAPVVVDLPVDDALRAELSGLVDRVCAGAG
ncbi:hypothetical protein [Blastococcus xanthinilyticus]|uniref:Lipoprotein n=1 Tax=Blastococcus xanthinilyticus TaxID=1564164 RepID=A0A5S5CW81_9ACTN|nr:hypothetical protein [Blastococcus xanthinilyticus]TYP87865.1 hypothetical protein BD833_10536 [Blastococcus xanthinilyticus]